MRVKLFERNELEILECDPVSDDKWLKTYNQLMLVDCLGVLHSVN